MCYCRLFSIWTTRKMHDFQGYFSRTFQVLEFSRKKSRTFQDFPGGVRTLSVSTTSWHDGSNMFASVCRLNMLASTTFTRATTCDAASMSTHNVLQYRSTMTVTELLCFITVDWMARRNVENVFVFSIPVQLAHWMCYDNALYKFTFYLLIYC